jgi:hypothetical protein
MESEYQRIYRQALDDLMTERFSQYHRRLEQFSEDSIKTFRLLVPHLSPEQRALIDAMELDYQDLQNLKKH